MTLAILMLVVQTLAPLAPIPFSPTPSAVDEAKNVLRGLRIYKVNGSKLEFVGSACPTSSWYAYSVLHVFDEEGIYVAAENNGLNLDEKRLIPVRVVKRDKKRDLVEITLEDRAIEFPYYFPLGKTPKPGAVVIGILVLPNGSATPSFGRLFGDWDDYQTSNIPSSPGSSGMTLSHNTCHSTRFEFSPCSFSVLLPICLPLISSLFFTLPSK